MPSQHISFNRLALLVIALSGALALVVGRGSLPDDLAGLAFALALIGGLGITRPRQPQAVGYQPRNVATRLMKWVSAPQLEAALLLWFGVALLAQAGVQPVMETVIDSALGALFLGLGWLLLAHLPGPLEFTLIVSTRLLFTALLGLEALAEGAPLVTLGAYSASIGYGLVAIGLHWTLREVAEQVASLRQEVRQISS